MTSTLRTARALIAIAALALTSVVLFAGSVNNISGPALDTLFSETEETAPAE